MLADSSQSGWPTTEHDPDWFYRVIPGPLLLYLGCLIVYHGVMYIYINVYISMRRCLDDVCKYVD